MTDTANGLTTASYYFLLKTENVQPLVDVIDQLTAQINQNQAAIGRLTDFVDRKMKFPELELGSDVLGAVEKLKSERGPALDDSNEDKSIESATNRKGLMHRISEEDLHEEGAESSNDEASEESPDTLRHILDSKYKLSEIELNESELVKFQEQISELEKLKLDKSPRIRQLIEDNLKLQRLQYVNKVKNFQLVNVIHEYETLLVEHILPPLRSELVEYEAAEEKKSTNGSLNTRQCIDIKFEMLDRIYSRYSVNLDCLMKLIGTFHLLLEYLDTTDQDTAKLHQQFLSLSSLRENLAKYAAIGTV